MFEVGLVELGVIALVALLVLGPERLPRAARTVGLYVRKARQSWYSVRADIERELAADELRRSMQRAEQSVRDSAEEIRRDMDIAPPLATTTPATPTTTASTSAAATADEPPRPGHEPPAP